MKGVTDPSLLETARRCNDYESILSIQGYGISFANTPESESSPRCDLCINWLGGDCMIFLSGMRSGADRRLNGGEKPCEEAH